MIAYSQNARNTVWNRAELARRPLPKPAPVTVSWYTPPFVACAWETVAPFDTQAGELLFASHCRKELDAIQRTLKALSVPKAASIHKNTSELVRELCSDNAFLKSELAGVTSQRDRALEECKKLRLQVAQSGAQVIQDAAAQAAQTR